MPPEVKVGFKARWSGSGCSLSSYLRGGGPREARVCACARACGRHEAYWAGLAVWTPCIQLESGQAAGHWGRDWVGGHGGAPRTACRSAPLVRTTTHAGSGGPFQPATSLSIKMPSQTRQSPKSHSSGRRSCSERLGHTPACRGVGTAQRARLCARHARTQPENAPALGTRHPPPPPGPLIFRTDT